MGGGQRQASSVCVMCGGVRGRCGGVRVVWACGRPTESPGEPAADSTMRRTLACK